MQGTVTIPVEDLNDLIARCDALKEKATRLKQGLECVDTLATPRGNRKRVAAKIDVNVYVQRRNNQIKK